MPTYNEPTKPDVTYIEPSIRGWLTTPGWFVDPWFGGENKGNPSYAKPEKSTPNYDEPSKGE